MSLHRDDDTDACAGPDRAPRRPENPPGQSRIDYRIAARAAVLDRMRHAVPRTPIADPATGRTRLPLERLRTDLRDDPANALMEAFAASLDALSFYSERVANEGYMATATQRERVRYLAESIGYRPAPGVAASVHLAFQVDDASDPYREVALAPGIQAASIPQAPDDLPQTYETIEAITARAEWNAIPLRATRPQVLTLYRDPDDEEDPRNGTLYLFDLDESFAPEALSDPGLEEIGAEGDLAAYHPMDASLDLSAALEARQADAALNPEIAPVLRAVPVDEAFLPGIGLRLKPGMRMIAVGQAPGGIVHARTFRLASVEERREFGVTAVVLSEGGEPPAEVRRAPVSIPPKLTYGTIPTRPQALSTSSLQTQVSGVTWTGAALDALVAVQAWSPPQVMTLYPTVPGITLRAPGDTPPVPLGLVVLRETVSAFGHAAPLWDTVKFGDLPDDGGPDKGPFFKSWDNPADLPTIWTDSQGTLLPGSAQMYLEREVKEIRPGGWVVLETPEGSALPFRIRSAATESRADYVLTTKAAGLALSAPDGTPVEPPEPVATSPLNAFTPRGTQVHAVSETLGLSGIPLEETVPAGTTALDLDGLYLRFERGRPVSVAGPRADAVGLDGSETHVIAEVLHVDGTTRLLLESGLAHAYLRPSLRICGNVAAATHGERVTETLGSGDARQPGQSFALGRRPLTHVPAPTPSGLADTAEIRVDGVLWSRVDTLAEAGPRDAVYTLRIGDDGTAVVTFGDGAKGRRLPTGEMNVEASYRVGLGLVGHQPAGAISQLRTRVLGLSAVTNPGPATGAADPAGAEAIRQAAPGSVRTLGRAVSLTDHADFALGFAGIGKARADAVWAGTEKAVHLTVAPEEAGPLDPATALVSTLRDALEAARAPGRPLLIAPYLPVYFALTARLGTDPAHRPADVAGAARAALDANFGYAARALAQPVSAAEVIAVLHRVPGVRHVDLDALYRIEDGAPPVPDGVPPQAILPAFAARGPAPGRTGAVRAAECLSLLPGAALLTAEVARDV
ncbi:MAG: putative baseplate assembly protein [Roseicyclus sp.]